MKPWQRYKHITKLDPDKNNSTEIINKVCNSNTDAVMLSGTTGITPENVKTLFKSLREYDKPILQEPANANVIEYDVDFLFIPIVLNSQEIRWVVDEQINWLSKIVENRIDLPWDRIVTEGYIVLNPNSAVANVTRAKTNLTAVEVATYASYAQFLGLNAAYIEYSGIYGNVDAVKLTKDFMSKSKLYYGGGITTKSQSQEMLEHVDTIFVGNILYNDLNSYLDTIPNPQGD